MTLNDTLIAIIMSAFGGKADILFATPWFPTGTAIAPGTPLSVEPVMKRAALRGRDPAQIR